MRRIETTQGMLDAYDEGWQAGKRWEDEVEDKSLIVPGAKRRCGLNAVFGHPDFQRQVGPTWTFNDAA